MWNGYSKIASVHGWSKGNTNLRNVKRISEYFIKPKYKVEESKKPYHLAPHDLKYLSNHHIQFGLLYTKPSLPNDQKFSIHSFLQSLKESLSLTLIHFYPLAGQLATEVDKDKHESIVYVDCNKGSGARFIHATLDMTISDILSPIDVPLIVQSLFNLNEETVNYDDHSKPLLSIQVTELLDGIFISCSINHCITDGTSYWHFWHIWSEIHRGNGNLISESRLPVYTRWFPDGRAPGPFPLPFIHPDEFIVRKSETPQLRDRIFHISSESMERLKDKANEESYGKKISSLQALCALIWRSIVRAINFPHDQVIINHLPGNSRERLDPPLPKYYFGNFITPLTTTTTAGELLENDLGWAASLLHQSVVNFNDKAVRDFTDKWLKSPFCNLHVDYRTVVSGNSPKFDMYGVDFGLGKAIVFRSGRGNKCDGYVLLCPGCEGGGSVDIEICLRPDSMDALESDKEFMAFISFP